VQSTSFETPMARRSGGIIPGRPARADASMLFFKTEYGETAIAWKDISVPSMIALANRVVSEPNPERKKWLTGVYATLCGSEAEGKQILIDAAQADESLRDNLAVFFDQAK
jgi:hypothetical protein